MKFPRRVIANAVRRPMVAAVALGALAVSFAATPDATHAAGSRGDGAVLSVQKTPTCGCCGAWAALASEHGYRVEVEDVADYEQMKAEAAVPEDLWSCHTATIAGYVVEGHVPFDALEKLLEERPDIDGISGPGMPAGSPGMGSDPAASFDVIAYGGAAGDGAVFHSVGN